MYNRVICGGTFDHLHRGHKLFLDFAFSQGKQVILGITSDMFIARYKKHAGIQPYGERKQAVAMYLEKQHMLDRVSIVSLDDIVGPAAIDPVIHIDAIVATDETQTGANKLNQARLEKGLTILPIIIFPRITNVSSSLIRQGTIDTNGEVFIDPYWTTKTHTLPIELRKELQKPLGTLFMHLPHDILAEKTITVGDVTTKLFNSQQIFHHISVIDFTVERKKLFSSLQDLAFSGKEIVHTVTNPSSTVTPQLWDTVQYAVWAKERSVIKIIGEEDLSVIPLVLTAPLGWEIFYGQPGEGFVRVVITLAIKRYVYSLLQRFL